MGQAETGVQHNLAAQLDNLLPAQSGPFAVERIREAAERVHDELEAACLRAQLRAAEHAVVDLFCLLAQNSPEVLPGPWDVVYELLAAEERFWVYPRVTLGEILDGEADAFTPYLNRCTLAAEWAGLVSHADRVLSARKSGERHALTS